MSWFSFFRPSAHVNPLNNVESTYAGQKVQGLSDALDNVKDLTAVSVLKKGDRYQCVHTSTLFFWQRWGATRLDRFLENGAAQDLSALRTEQLQKLTQISQIKTLAESIIKSRETPILAPPSTHIPDDTPIPKEPLKEERLNMKPSEFPYATETNGTVIRQLNAWHKEYGADPATYKNDYKAMFQMLKNFIEFGKHTMASGELDFNKQGDRLKFVASIPQNVMREMFIAEVGREPAGRDISNFALVMSGDLTKMPESSGLRDPKNFEYSGKYQKVADEVNWQFEKGGFILEMPEGISKYMGTLLPADKFTFVGLLSKDLIDSLYQEKRGAPPTDIQKIDFMLSLVATKETTAGVFLEKFGGGTTDQVVQRATILHNLIKGVGPSEDRNRVYKGLWNGLMKFSEGLDEEGRKVLIDLLPNDLKSYLASAHEVQLTKTTRNNFINQLLNPLKKESEV